MKAIAFMAVLSMVLLSTAALAEESTTREDRTDVSDLTLAHGSVTKGTRGNVPGLMNYQGTLVDLGGLALDTTVSMSFSIYTDSTGGTQVWTESQSSVAVSNGIFNVLLGSVNAISDTVFNNSPRWLGVQVESDPEMQPRQLIGSVPYAFWAAGADTADYVRHGGGGDDGDWTISGDDMYSTVSGNVGIGTTNPLAKLHVEEGSTADLVWIRQAGSTKFVLTNDGKVGIGTTSPTCALDVNGDVKVDMIIGRRGDDDTYIRFINDQIDLYAGNKQMVKVDGASATGSVVINEGGDIANFRVESAFNENILFVDGLFSNVGIGTANPTEKLDVDGNIHASGTITSGSSITIDGVNDKITASSGTIDFDDENIITTGKATIGPGHTNTGINAFVAGQDNDAIGDQSIIGGGRYNLAGAQYSTVSGGYADTASGNYATVGGGYRNASNNIYGTVGGGGNNTANGSGTTVSGGRYNDADSIYAAVGGGYNNAASGNYTFVGGGVNNTAYGSRVTLSGGGSNTANGSWATVGGGRYNATGDDYTTVGGGYADTADGHYATVGGGRNNTASDTCATVSGGYRNTASNEYATVGGGYNNRASGRYSTGGGGWSNYASGIYSFVGGGWNNQTDGGTYYATVAGGKGNRTMRSYATVGGGEDNIVIGEYAIVGGGRNNRAGGLYATVGGGYADTASGVYSTVGGGRHNLASYYYATVGGGHRNTASDSCATVAGGWDNLASGDYATVAGGHADTSSGDYSFSVGNQSKAFHNNSAAFNGQATTASAQTRVGFISKGAGTFTIDHPLDPMNTILNHYFIESPEMVLIYRGTAHIGAGGRAEVHLPNYFDALNQNPMVQLTGVGTSDVYVADEVKGNGFVIGGKPGTKVYWTVTGERKDPTAEITKILMPVEQPKDGELAGRSLDDDLLASTMMQLERMGQAGKFGFRTQRGRAKYEASQRALENPESMGSRSRE